MSHFQRSPLTPVSRTMAQQPVTLVGNVQHLYLLPTYPYP
jgi:hypothetical protein